jgi:hypothetical protein
MAGEEMMAMTASNDKRNVKRMDCRIPIPVHVSIFNSKYSTEAQLMNHCMDGISFTSDQAFLLGTAIVIRIAYGKLKNTCNNDLETLPSMRLGEVKWCRKVPGEASTAYKVGIKYYFQGY